MTPEHHGKPRSRRRAPSRKCSRRGGNRAGHSDPMLAAFSPVSSVYACRAGWYELDARSRTRHVTRAAPERARRLHRCAARCVPPCDGLLPFGVRHLGCPRLVRRNPSRSSTAPKGSFSCRDSCSRGSIDAACASGEQLQQVRQLSGVLLRSIAGTCYCFSACCVVRASSRTRWSQPTNDMGLPSHLRGPHWQQGALLVYQPKYFDILPLYILFLPAGWFFTKRQLVDSRWLPIASIAIWTAQQFRVTAFASAITFGVFNPAAYQMLFLCSGCGSAACPRRAHGVPGSAASPWSGYPSRYASHASFFRTRGTPVCPIRPSMP